MYVCICKAVTDKQIRRAAASGVDKLHELRAQLGVASGCGMCANEAQMILSEANEMSLAGPSIYYPTPA